MAPSPSFERTSKAPRRRPSTAVETGGDGGGGGIFGFGRALATPQFYGVCGREARSLMPEMPQIREREGDSELGRRGGDLPVAARAARRDDRADPGLRRDVDRVAEREERVRREGGVLRAGPGFAERDLHGLDP